MISVAIAAGWVVLEQDCLLVRRIRPREVSELDLPVSQTRYKKTHEIAKIASYGALDTHLTVPIEP